MRLHNPTKKAGLVFATALGSLSLATLQAGFKDDAPIGNPGAATEEGFEVAAGEVIVRFRTDVPGHQVVEALLRVGGETIETKRTAAMAASGHQGISRISVNIPVAKAIAALANHPAVESVEPNYKVYRQANLVDDYFYGSSVNSLWGAYGSNTGNVIAPANPFGSQADEAWWRLFNLAPPLAPVYVGVIDEGICYYHPDLDANIGNPLEIADGADNDGNGFVDDVYGRDFYSDDNSVFDPVPGQPEMDLHGTHVAGTIGAEANNAIGVAGVHPSVKLISGKFLGPDGGYTWDAIDAIDYFVDLKSRGVNLVALNNSWGGGDYSAELAAAIIRAANSGILFVAAAGNGNLAGIGQNNDSVPSYPASYNTTQPVVVDGVQHVASYDSVISVAAIDKSGNRAGFSNYGATSVDLAAPGVSIVSTYPFQVDTASQDPVSGAYYPLSGTSMATPHVTGAAALYAALYPAASPASIKAAILHTALPTSSMAGRCVTGGRLSLARTDEAPLEPPTTPTGLSAVSSTKGAASLSWSDSTHETSYELQRANDSAFKRGAVTTTLPANQTAVTLTGLKSGATLYFRIRSLNGTLPSAYSSTVSVKIR